MSEALSAELKSVWERAKEIDICMMNSRDDNGQIHSRPMSVQKKFDGTFLFLTDFNSGKIREIEHDNHIGLSFSDIKSNTYLSVSGTAEAVSDQQLVKELWNPLYEAWFPKGPEDPNIAVLKGVPEKAEWWDSPTSPMIMLLGFAKAKLTGKPYEDEGAVHEKIDLGSSVRGH